MAVAALKAEIPTTFVKRRTPMTITTIRVSDTEVQVERTLYTFARESDADSFQRCLADTSIDSCYRSHPPLSARPTVPDEHPDDPGRGSTISPSLGGMP
jgi:hypothetical protein